MTYINVAVVKTLTRAHPSGFAAALARLFKGDLDLTLAIEQRHLQLRKHYMCLAPDRRLCYLGELKAKRPFRVEKSAGVIPR